MSVRTPSLMGPFCATAGADTAMSISVNPSDLRWTPRRDLPRDFIAFSPPNPARIDSPKRRGAEVKLLQINTEPPSDRRRPRRTRPGSRNPRCVRGAPGFYWVPHQLIGARSPRRDIPFVSVSFKTLDLNLLKVFDAVMEERSVLRASQKVALSQSAVSHSLARLREMLEDELFVRTATGMQPTSRALAMAPLV